MKLHLIRHAKTEVQSDTGQDFDRCLTERGKAQAKDLRDFLKNKLETKPNTWYSAAKRTTQTWSIIRNGFTPNSVTALQELYLCEKQVFLQKIWADTGMEDILIVAHNNGISDLANYFLGTDLVMKTGEYLCLEFEIDQWVEASMDMATLSDRFRSEA